MAPGRAIRSSLAIRLALALVLVSGLGMAAMAVYVTRVLETNVVDSLRAGLVTEAGLVHDAVVPLLGEPARPGALQDLAGRYGARSKARVTIIAPDGTVLGDSERTGAALLAMENHAGRPEVAAALRATVGTDVRRSRTLDLEMLYVATALSDRGRVVGVLRLALPLRDVARAASTIRRTVAVGAGLAFALACAVGLFVSRRVTRPVAEMRAAAHRMAEGDFDQRVPVHGRDEVADLGRALNALAARLGEKIGQLEGERAKVGAILDSMVEGVVAVDARGRLLLANPAGRALLGVGPAPVEGRPLVEVVREKALLDLVEARRGTGAGLSRHEVELGPPASRTLEVHAASLAVAPGAPGTLLVLHDVTELRRLERVRTEFVANVSHELRTPLAAIQGALETLLDGALEDRADARRFLEIAHRHAERLGRLVDDLLQLSDIETGRARLVPAPVGLDEVAREVVEMFERRAVESRLALSTEVPPDLRVHADRDRLAQILVNLVDNAVKHTPAGGRVTLGAVPGAPGWVEIRVGDTGTGIPSTDLPRLTERFYRVDRARSRELGGTGLGLAIVKHLVQSHGGVLRIESELGKGTTVRVTLPAA